MITYNLLDIDDLVDKFIKDSYSGIYNLHKYYYKTDSEVSLQALLLSLKEELKTGSVSFLNKNSSTDGLYPYLFYIVNAYCKKNAVILPKKKHDYICPGCLFNGQESILELYKNFVCHECSNNLKSEQDPKKKLLYKSFALHSKGGYRCPNCSRFLPDSISSNEEITCPYSDCIFSGSVSTLKKMHHPSTSYIPEVSVLDHNVNGASPKDIIPATDNSPLESLENKENEKMVYDLLVSVIDSQKSLVHYNSSDSTSYHKVMVYQAISNLLEKYRQDMIDYLIYDSRSGGFQHKIFQEYISLLEKELPLVFKKNGKVYRIESLLDDNLDLFKGISEFSAIINENSEIKNNTSEFYIGGRKGSITRPYYIGKVLSVVNSLTKESLTSSIKEYSFNKIKMQNVVPGTPVIVTHLRVIPHYQMGGMVYINRIRKKIVDKAKSSLSRLQ